MTSPTRLKLKLRALPGLVLACTAPLGALGQDGGKLVYRCPGPPVLYTDALSAQEAHAKGCRTIEGTPVTVVQAVKPRPVASSPAGKSADAKVEAAAQRARDADRRTILSDELRVEEVKLAELKKEFNNGEPERRGDERNYQRYLDRVAEMKAAILRKEGDIAAIKREIAKLPQ